mgnify:CR=1 FL=1
MRPPKDRTGFGSVPARTLRQNVAVLIGSGAPGFLALRTSSAMRTKAPSGKSSKVRGRLGAACGVMASG